MGGTSCLGKLYHFGGKLSFSNGENEAGKSVGPCTDINRNFGLGKRGMLAGLKAIDFVCVPLKPQGVYLETLRAQIPQGPFWSMISEQYNIGVILERIVPKTGFANKPVIIRTDKGRYALKEKKSFDSPSDKTSSSSQEKIHFEAAVARHLQQKGFPYPRIYNNRKGEPFVDYEGRCFVLYDFLPGKVNAIGDASWFEFIAVQRSAASKLTPAELAALKNFFLMETLDVLLWFHEKHQEKIAGKKIEWITDHRIIDQLALVRQLLQLDWDRIQSSVISRSKQAH